MISFRNKEYEQRRQLKDETCEYRRFEIWRQKTCETQYKMQLQIQTRRVNFCSTTVNNKEDVSNYGRTF